MVDSMFNGALLGGDKLNPENELLMECIASLNNCSGACSGGPRSRLKWASQYGDGEIISIFPAIAIGMCSGALHRISI